MDILKARHILEIDENADEAVIKKSYKKLLPVYNPEDDPEGFKRLREAYETALEALKGTDSKEEEKPDDEIEHWLDKVRNVYADMERRTDTGEWRRLFEDPLVQALDTAFSLRERFLVWVMDYHFMPCDVWKVINSELAIPSEADELKEKFPTDFIDFVIHQGESENFGSYSFFEVPPGTEVDVTDKYIAEYYGLNRNVSGLEASLNYGRLPNNGETEGGFVIPSTAEVYKREEYAESIKSVKEMMEGIRAYGVYHPYEDLERIRFAILSGSAETESARDGRVNIKDLAVSLKERYRDDAYILRIAGEALAASDEWEEAKKFWEEGLKLEPDHGPTILDMASYIFHTEDPSDAEKYLRSKSAFVNGDPRVRVLFSQIQQALEEKYRKKIEEAPDDPEAYMEYCWSLFHTDRIDEVLKALDERSYEPGSSVYYDYVDMKGRCLLEKKQYTEALKYIKLWEDALLNLKEDGDAERFAQRKKTRPYQCFVIGECYFHLAHRENEKENFELAAEYVEKAIETEEDRSMIFSYEDLLARIYLHSGREEKCLDMMEERLKQDPGYLPGYIRRQDANYRLRNAQEVIDDYHTIVSMYKDYYRTYAMALRVLNAFEQNDAIDDIVKTVRESGLEHPAVEFEILRSMRRQKEKYTKEDLFKQLDKILDLIKDNPDMTDPEIPEEDRISIESAELERAYIYYAEEDVENALLITEENIKKGGDNLPFYALRADIYRMKEDYGKALEFYKDLLKRDKENAYAAYYAGICCSELGHDSKEAAAYFEEALSYDEEFDRAVYQLARLYHIKYTDSDSTEAYERALKEYDRLAELNPTAFVYSERARLKSLRYDIDGAVKDLETAVNLDPGGEECDDYLLYRLGDLYFFKRELKKAEETYKKAVEVTNGSQQDPVMKLADIEGCRGNWEAGCKLLERYADGFKDSSSYCNKLLEFLSVCGRLSDAKALISRMLSAGMTDNRGALWLTLRMSLTADPENYELYLSQAKEALRADYKAPLLRTGADGRGRSTAGVFHNMVTKLVSNEDPKDRKKKDAEYYETMGSYLLFAGKLKESYAMLTAAYDISKECNRSTGELLRSLAICARLSGKKEEAVLYARERISYLLRAYDNSEEKYLGSRESDNSIRLDSLSLMYFCAGEYEKALKYSNMIESCVLCRQCRYQNCYDRLITLGYYALFKGDRNKAKEAFIKAKAICPYDRELLLVEQIL